MFLIMPQALVEAGARTLAAKEGVKPTGQHLFVYSKVAGLHTTYIL